MEILKVENVVKKFGDNIVSNHLSFGVTPGRIMGLIGPNGAGKTTLIRMITNIITPDEGSIYMFGEPVGPAHQNRIGYLPEERGLYKKIKVLEQIIYFGRLKGLSRTDAMAKGRYWLHKMEADDWAGKKIQELSKGMQQKIQFISTILHDPEVLILDEPFSGFDPVNTDLIKKIVLEMRDSGKTIILSTHVMEQAEQLCDDICLINKGNFVLKGNLMEIKRSFGKDSVIMEFEGSDGFLDGIPDIKILNRTLNRVEFRLINGRASAGEILKTAVNNVNLIKYEISEPSLNEIFIETVTGRKEALNGAK